MDGMVAELEYLHGVLKSAGIVFLLRAVFSFLLFSLIDSCLLLLFSLFFFQLQVSVL